MSATKSLIASTRQIPQNRKLTRAQIELSGAELSLKYLQNDLALLELDLTSKLKTAQVAQINAEVANIPLQNQISVFSSQLQAWSSGHNSGKLDFKPTLITSAALDDLYSSVKGS